MKFIDKIKTICKFYINLDNKDGIVKRFISIYIREGMHGVKSRIFREDQKGLCAHGAVDSEKDCLEEEKVGWKIFIEQQAEYSRSELEDIAARFLILPKISIIMPVYNVEPALLCKAIDSVLGQIYENWELCAFDDGSTDGRVRSVLEEYSCKDSRVKVGFSSKNEGISGASNKSLEMSTGDFIALIDNDDVVTPDAFFWVAKAINDNDKVDFIYSDECKIDDSGEENLFEFVFKPDWSKNILLRFMYTNHLTVYRTEVVRKIGGFRSKYDTAQDFDLALRVSEVTENIVHIERLLYKWRAIKGSVASGGKPKVVNVGALVASDMCQRIWGKSIIQLRNYCYNHKLISLDQRKVSIVLLTDNYERTVCFVDNLIQNVCYRNFELIIVSNSKLIEDIKDKYKYIQNIVFCFFDKKMNFSEKCNRGAGVSTGSIIIFCQDKIIFNQKEWIDIIVDTFDLQNDVGAVSPKIVRNDDSIQYAGMVTGMVGLIGIPYNGRGKNQFDDSWTRHMWIREVSVLSATCMAIRQDVFARTGGFDCENTPDKFSNADMSFKIQELGYKCIYNSNSEIACGYEYSFDSWYLNPDVTNSHSYILRKWWKYMERDKYFTNSMKREIVTEFPYQYKIYNNQFDGIRKEKGSVLLVSHELSLTGAPIVLCQAAKILSEAGYFAVIISDKDGPLREEMKNSDVLCIVDPWLYNDEVSGNFYKSFDFVICNTICTYQIINNLNGVNVPVLWWVHESAMSYSEGMVNELLPKSINNNISIYCAGDYAMSMMHKYMKYKNLKVLLYGIDDLSDGHKITKREKVNIDFNGKKIFLLVGSIEIRKRQDILAEAISRLPDNVLNGSLFCFVGKNYDDEIYKKIIHFKGKFPDNIFMFDELSRDDMNFLYKKSDVVISTSFDDPMPVVMTEGMMFEKICICSKNTGTASLITNGTDGFIFDPNNISELVEKIVYVFENMEHLDQMRSKSREIYEKYFSMDIFRNNLLNAVDSLRSKKKIAEN